MNTDENEIYYGIVNVDDTLTFLEGDIFDYFSQTDKKVDLKDVRLLPPCNPTKIAAVGLNYADHAKELNLKNPQSFPPCF